MSSRIETSGWGNSKVGARSLNEHLDFRHFCSTDPLLGGAKS